MEITFLKNWLHRSLFWSQCCKTLSGWNRDITKIWKQLVLKPEPEQKCENNAIVAQKYSLKLFIGFKMSCSCYTQLRGKSIFPRFAQKKFYNIDNGSEPFWKRLLCWVFFAVAISYDYKASVTKFKRKFLNSSWSLLCKYRLITTFWTTPVKDNLEACWKNGRRYDYGLRLERLKFFPQLQLRSTWVYLLKYWMGFLNLFK